MQVIDCIVIGYNDSRMESLVQKTEPFRAWSGGYRHLLANSVSFSGTRMKYTDLLNACVERATGRPSALHVARLPNLGACYLVSFLRKRGIEAMLINFFNHEADVLADLLKERVHVVAITTTYYIESDPIQELVRFVRDRNPDALIVVGGPHIFNLCSDNTREDLRLYFKAMGADLYVFDSQGELALTHICNRARKGLTDFSDIPNVISSEDDWETMVQNPRKIEDNDMTENVVDWSLFQRDLIAPTVQTRTARSCAFKCAFCRYPVMAGRLNLVDLDAVEDELDYLADAGVRYVLFIDDTFNIPEPRFKELCRRMIAKRYGLQWFSYFRCANADDETFELMARAGCKGVFLGIESGDQAVLRAMSKAAKVERYLHGVKKLNDAGIVTYASFIVGHPGDTPESARNTFRFIEEARPTYYCLESFFYDPKTPIGAKATEFGLQGRGYRWEHAGMDWRQAAELVEEGYRTIGQSVVLPLYGFDLWSYAYLLGAGIEESTLDRFLRISSKLMLQGIDRPRAETLEYERRLEGLFAQDSSRLLNAARNVPARTPSEIR